MFGLTPGSAGPKPPTFQEAGERPRSLAPKDALGCAFLHHAIFERLHHKRGFLQPFP